MDLKRIRLSCISCYLCMTGTTYGIISPKMPREDPLPKKAQSGKGDPESYGPSENHVERKARSVMRESVKP